MRRRFQLVGIACLRAAMADTRAKESQAREEADKDLDPARFAYISDRTYSAAEVEEVTAVVQAGTPACMRSAPTAKMFLRSFWYRSVVAGLLTPEEMHIYTVARCAPGCIRPPLLCRPACAGSVSAAPLHASLWLRTQVCCRGLPGLSTSGLSPTLLLKRCLRAHSRAFQPSCRRAELYGMRCVAQAAAPFGLSGFPRSVAKQPCAATSHSNLLHRQHVCFFNGL